MRTPARLLLLLLLAVPSSRTQIIHAKDGEPRPSFESIAIKPNNSGRNGQSARYAHGRYTATNVEVRSLIKSCYGLRSDAELIGGDAAILSEHIDINAKIDDALAQAIDKMRNDDRRRTISLMQQSLLEDRFHLRLHFATKNMSVLALIVAKGGAKLTPATGNPMPATDLHSAPLNPGGSYEEINGNTAQAAAADSPLQTLANILSEQPEAQGLHVIDKTNLPGKYDWLLHWNPRPDSVAAAQTEEPTLTEALRTQLGLQLKPDKADVETIVIDKIQQFSDN